MNNNFNIEMLQEWAETVEPVFIVGPERSGTSMMFRTVVSHPSFCSFDNATVETFAFIRPQVLLQKPSPDNYEMRLYLGKQFNAFHEAIAPIIATNKKCDTEGEEVTYLGGSQKVRSSVWQKRCYRDLLRAFFYFSWLNLGEKRLAEKTPAHVRCTDELFDCFPKAKVLVCLRDPVEIVASHRKRLAKEVELGKSGDDPSLGWLTKNSVEYVKYFNQIKNKVGRAKRIHSDRVMSVSYGRVTTSEIYLQSIFSFLDENYDVQETDTKSLHTPEWDPLLASNIPKSNQIEVSRWVSQSEIMRLREGCAAEGFDSWR